MPRFDPAAALRPTLRQLPEYAALEDLEMLAARYGVSPEHVIKIDGNENPFGPSPRALDALRAATGANHYGDPDQRRLRAAISKHFGVPPESIVAGSGSDEIIDLVFRLFTAEGDRILVSTPTFGMYAFDAGLHGVEVTDVPLLEGWTYDGEAMVDAAMEAKATFIPSPNNPTGNVLSHAIVDRLLETGTLLVLDEAYIEFSHQPSLVQRAAAEPGLVVLRTLSKWGGLAGLRIGYGIMHPDTADYLMRVKQPYNVNSAAEAAAIASFEDAAVLDERACVLAGERDRVSASLASLGWVHPWPSQSNFVLLRLAHGDGRTVRDMLRARGVFARYFDHPRLRDHIRISIALPEQNDRVIEAFREIGEELTRG